MIAVTLSTFVALGAPPELEKNRDEYVAKLTATESTAEAHFKLATWARRQGMQDVADGHARTAVHLDPAFTPAQKTLGRSFRDGKWETKDERRVRLDKEEGRQRERALWLRTLNEVGVAAAASVRTLTDAGIAAVEQFSFGDENREAAAVRVYGDSDLGTATLAIMREAVASQFPRVRLAASKALAERNPDHYIVALLEFLKPRQAGKSVVLGVGEVWYWQEGTTMFVAAPARPAPNVPSSLNRSTEPEGGLAGRQAESERIRANAVSTLQVVTGKKIGDDFAEWRKEIMQVSGTYVERKQAKPTSMTATYYKPETTITGTSLLPTLAYTDVAERVGHYCFAAGTPVLTKRGMIPIDQVCVGELVLSRKVESGETAYKPVLARTLRPRIPMKKLTVGAETLVTTAGHPFWTPEKGWTKAKNLSKGLSLGGDDGTIQLTGLAGAEEPQQAYNLVVADFGTYFVGKSRILVHDDTPIRDAPAKVSK